MVEFGHTVCLGCKADVIYGATKQENEQAFCNGLLVGGILSFYLLSELPKWLASNFGWPLVLGWGLGGYVFYPGAVIMAFIVLTSIRLTDDGYRKGKPRFFRHTIA
jgi:hypothetical protein